jgi:hypothetical protein
MHALIREVPRPYSARPAGPARSPRRAPRVGLHLKPGQKGTKQLVAQYGNRLLCVRYRYDPERCKRLKTIEIIVAERDWAPRRPRLRREQVVGLHVPYADTVTRAQVKQAGGQWHPEPSNIRMNLTALRAARYPGRSPYGHRLNWRTIVYTLSECGSRGIRQKQRQTTR